MKRDCDICRRKMLSGDVGVGPQERKRNMPTKAELQERIDELEGKLNDIKEALGVAETEETLQDVKEALKEVGLELPEDDSELAGAIDQGLVVKKEEKEEEEK